MSQYRVVFVRHGESEWTFENLFCGWVDISLTDKGKLGVPAVTVQIYRQTKGDTSFVSTNCYSLHCGSIEAC